MNATATGTPRGPEEVRAALITACERLCSERPPAAVTVRDVAAEANVTTGLVHHYFASKDAMLVATARSLAEEIAARAAAAYRERQDAGDMVAAVWTFFAERPAFRSLVSSWAIEGRDVTELMGEHPFVQALDNVLGAGSGDSRLRTGLIVNLLLSGYVSAGVNRAMGADEDDPGLRDALERLSVRIARGQIDPG